MKTTIPRAARCVALFLAACLAVTGAAACNDGRLATAPEGPTAVIEGPQTASPLDVVLFDGSASHVEQSVIVGWEWRITARPGGSNFPLVQDADDPRRATFQVDIAGDYEVELRVVDERGMDDTARFRFSAVPWQTVHVELTWDRAETDLDLHLVSESEGGAFWTEPFDCFFENTNPDWGAPGIDGDDPSIDIDDVDGFGPENVSLNQPQDAHAYRVVAHYYDDHGQGAATATVRIYLSGELRYEGIRPLDRTGAGWDVARIHWPSGEVEGVDQPFFYAP